MVPTSQLLGTFWVQLMIPPSGFSTIWQKFLVLVSGSVLIITTTTTSFYFNNNQWSLYNLQFAKHFLRVMSCNSPIKFVRLVKTVELAQNGSLLKSCWMNELYPFYCWGNWDSKRSSDLPKATLPSRDSNADLLTFSSSDWLWYGVLQGFGCPSPRTCLWFYEKSYWENAIR